MPDRQIASEAHQLARAIEQNPDNMSGASQMLFVDTLGMGRDYAHALIDQTNQITQSDSQRDGCQYGQIWNPHETQQDGWPVVEFVDGQNKIITTVALNLYNQYYQTDFLIRDNSRVRSVEEHAPISYKSHAL